MGAPPGSGSSAPTSIKPGTPRLPGAPRRCKSESRPLRRKRSFNALDILLRQRPHGDWAGRGTTPRISQGIKERAWRNPSPSPARRDGATERTLAHQLHQDLAGDKGARLTESFDLASAS